MEMNMCNGFYELNEVDMYAIDGGMDLLTLEGLKRAGMLVLKTGAVGIGIVAVGFVVGFGCEMIFGD